MRLRRIPRSLWGLVLGLVLILGLLLPATVSWANSANGNLIQSRDRLLNQGKGTAVVPLIEQIWQNDFETYFQQTFAGDAQTTRQISRKLQDLGRQTGKKPAILYILPRSAAVDLVLLTPTGTPIHRRVAAAKLDRLEPLTQEFINAVTRPTSGMNRYLPLSQKLYRWLIFPVETELRNQKIQTILFCMGPGLRTLPLAALHDGKRFLIEKYSFSRIPAFNLTDTNLGEWQNGSILAMGASEFNDLSPLPSVPTELERITQQGQRGSSYLNQDFTVENLKSKRLQNAYPIVHLATHADFQAGKPQQSFIQFWDQPLTLDQMRQLNWRDPPVELLVLSACKTAIGDPEAELGFAGLAVQAQVKSALASLWAVSDEGTLVLMTEFYRQLPKSTLKADALNQAQISLLHDPNRNFSHPYFWAAFTLVGSPW